MKQRKIGRNGFSCSPIGYGAMSLAGIYGNATKDEAFDVLDACLEHGIDHIDTANVYGMGRSETLIGEWFAARGPDLRDQFTIATKASITRHPETNARMFSNQRAHLESELDKSLGLLGIESVDLFYIHRRDPDVSVEELGKTLADLIGTGKCKSVGLSEVAPTTIREIVEYCPIASVQSEYSLSTRLPELGVVQAAAEVGAALVAFSPVGRGLLTDTPPTPEYIAASGLLSSNPRFQKDTLAANIKAAGAFRKLAAEFEIPAAGLAISWLLAQGDHVVPIPGTRNLKHLAEIVAGCSVELSLSDLAVIEQALPVGWAHGDRYSVDQWIGPERYC